MSDKAAVGAGGTVRIKGDGGTELVLFVEPLPFRQEVSLLHEMRRLAKAQAVDFVAAVEPVLDRLAKIKTPEAAARAAAILQAAATMEARGDLPGDDAAETARRSPKGVATELWFRARRAHPDVALRDLEAVVTEANADDLHWQIREALGAADDPKS